MKLSRTRNSNLLPPIVLTPQNSASLGITDLEPQQIGREIFGPGRLDPEFDGINLIEDSASSTYDGLSFSVNHRVEEFTLSASYTFSKTIDEPRILPSNPKILLTSEVNAPSL